ncbi:hypothetical protein HanIR_Chr12g0608041 [Helianthus annuus]|nr:hypothetical protein HanIR_Chr12g0608041 [Helianthus annuus]
MHTQKTKLSHTQYIYTSDSKLEQTPHAHTFISHKFSYTQFKTHIYCHLFLHTILYPRFL